MDRGRICRGHLRTAFGACPKGETGNRSPDRLELGMLISLLLRLLPSAIHRLLMKQ